MAVQTVLVTGSARGIGYAIAEAFAASGANIILSDVQEELLEAAKVRLQASGAQVLAHPCDVSDPEACVRLVEAALAHFGGLDVLVNNAGISIVSDFEQCQPEVMSKLMQVNLLGAMYMTQASLAAIRGSKGSLVYVSSVSGIRAIPKGAIYSASKAGLRSFAESLRVELAGTGVHVGVVSPGFTTSDGAKTVMSGDGSARAIDRPAHDTPEGVAKQVLTLVRRRQRERVLTPLGKVTAMLQRLSPHLLDKVLQGRELQN